MTESEYFDLQGGSAAQRGCEKRPGGRQNRAWREPPQVSHFQLDLSLRDAQPKAAYCIIALEKGKAEDLPESDIARGSRYRVSWRGTLPVDNRVLRHDPVRRIRLFVLEAGNFQQLAAKVINLLFKYFHRSPLPTECH